MHTTKNRLTVIIPCYNEIETLAAIVRKSAFSLPNVPKQFVIVDDQSHDGSRELIEQLGSMSPSQLQAFLLDDEAAPDHAFLLPVIEPVIHESNGGKGRAIRSGLAAAQGDVIIIQDADLEYDPQDWTEMFALIEEDIADVVYGSRFYGRPHRSLNYHHYLGNRIISLAFNLLYNQILTDIETCYKMFKMETVSDIELTAHDFGIEVELSAAIVLARKWRIYEMGIRYFGRTYEEGKKIGWRDGVKALWYLWRFRFKNYDPNTARMVETPASQQLHDPETWDGPERRSSSSKLRGQAFNNQDNEPWALHWVHPNAEHSHLSGRGNQRGADRKGIDQIENTAEWN